MTVFENMLLLQYAYFFYLLLLHGAIGPFMSHLAAQLGYSTGEFQALQLIVRAMFDVVD